MLVLSTATYANNLKAPIILEATVDYGPPAPELVIIGKNLCNGSILEIVIVDTNLDKLSCQQVGNQDRERDLLVTNFPDLIQDGSHLLVIRTRTQYDPSENWGPAPNQAVFYLTVGAVGSRGDKGLQGDTGLQGLKGETGLQGQRGDTGPQSPKGDTGLQGPRGEQGPPGGAIAFTGLSCPVGQFITGFTEAGELICKALLLNPTPTTGGGTTVDYVPIFADACFSFNNTDAEDLRGNSWFDQCVDQQSTNLTITLRDNQGNPIYTASGFIPNGWTYSNLTSDSQTQYHVLNHKNLIELDNGDYMIIAGKESTWSSGGCTYSLGNGYGIVIYSAINYPNMSIRVMVMPYTHGNLDTPRQLSAGWSEANEISWAPDGDLNSCNVGLVENSPFYGSAEIRMN